MGVIMVITVHVTTPFLHPFIWNNIFCSYLSQYQTRQYHKVIFFLCFTATDVTTATSDSTPPGIYTSVNEVASPTCF